MIEAGAFLQQRYRIDKQIGQGGMGAVYVATDERFGSMVAIKETLCMDDNFRKAIEREARLLNSLKHSVLPRVSDHFEENDSQFLVMEYIPGDDIGTMLEPGKAPFPPEKAMKWADQLLDALDYLHNQEMPVIHRDIKPQNLKVTPRGDVILLDFGLAKGNPTDAGHNTAAKSIFGYSRNYASLEQIQGTGTGPRSDLYSLAATLYHLLTNVRPEDALSRAMAVLCQKPDPLVPANIINPAIPRGVAGVLQKALALNADERPSSANEMRQMFRESENYGYLADDVTVAGNVGHTVAFGQKTQLMPDATQAKAVKGTEAKTEVLAANVSQETAVRAALVGATNIATMGNTTQPGARRGGLGVVAGALGMLLVGGAIAGGIYIVKPSIYGLGQPATDKTTETSTVPPVTDANATAIAAANSNQAEPAVAAAGANSATAKAETNKPAETTKNNKPNGPNSTTIESDGTSVTMPTDGRPGEIVVNEKNPDGTTSTTVLKNGQMPKVGQHQDPMPPIPPGGVDFRNLTPVQKARVKAYVRKNGHLPPGINPPPN